MKDSGGSSAVYMETEQSVVRQCGTSAKVLVEHGEARLGCVTQSLPPSQVSTVVLARGWGVLPSC